MSLPKTHFASEPPREAGSDDASTNAVERAWADRIRAGHMGAFEALYRMYWERLYAFAFRYLRSQQDAEDAVQEVFFRIWRGRAEWVPAGAVRNYLYLAVRNAALDRLQRAAVARRRRVGTAQLVTVAEIQPDLEAAELAAAVERALCRLRLIDGLSYAEIAHRLAIGEKTVETQLARGLKFLRERIRQAQ